MDVFKKAAEVLAGYEAAKKAHERHKKALDWKDQADVQSYHQARREQERWELINKLTKGKFVCRCGKVVANLSGWIVVGRTAVCRSCFAMKRQKQKKKGTPMIDVLIEEPRYRIDGHALAQARILAGLSRRAFAEKAGWHPSYQQKLETGNVITVGFEVGQTIAQVLREAGIEILRKK